jgi:molybdopterin biosynthesis enzyme MoaB
LPDDFSLIRERLGAFAAETDLDAVFTTGGTGIGPRDRTPEATTAVMERSLPGLAELMRREGMKQTPRAALSRAVAGMRGKTLLINLPGSPSGAMETVAVLLEILPHAVDVIRGETVHAAPQPPVPVAAEAETPVTPQVSGEAGEESEPLGKAEPV